LSEYSENGILLVFRGFYFRKERNMKKKYVGVLLLAVVLTLTACSGSNTDTEAEADQESAAEEEAVDEEEELWSYDPVLYEDLTSTIISLGDYKGLTMTMTVEEVTDEDVQSEVDSIRQEYSELVDVDRAAEEGDTVVIDYTGYVDGETSDSLQGTDYSLELGSDTFVPGFEDQLIGAAAGDEVEVNITFPDDYYDDVAGKEARFDVTVKNVQAYDTEAWNDDFVKENTEYESIEDMETSIRENLEAQAQEDAESNLEYDLISLFLENSEFEIQDSDVELYIDEMMSEYQTYATYYGMELEEFLESYVGTTEDELREMMRETAEFRVKMTLSFHEIAEQEGITISDEEYQEQLNTLAEEYEYESAEAVEEAYSEAMIREQMVQEKVIDLIVENAIVE
jgi:trigger factor